jgi:hypothetical protein
MTVDSLGTGDAKEVFTNIFKKNWWNNDESRSGWGAELKRTESIRINLADFARRHALGSLLDAPCGDYNCMRHVAWPAGFRYVGADIVHDLIIENRKNYPGIEFMELDVLKDSPATRRCMACARSHDPLSRQGDLDRPGTISPLAR